MARDGCHDGFTKPLPLRGRKYEAWAIWNQCQGVFTDAVFHWREDAVKALPDYGEGAFVVPVRMTVDNPDDWPKRHWDQDEWERVHGRGRFAPKPA